MKIGLILEGGPEGPDAKVCSYLLRMLDHKIQIVCRTLTNKPGLIKDCGETANKLLEIDNCDKVVLVWDLYPSWREEKPCRKTDREQIIKKLKSAGVAKNKYALVCIEEELEAWLVADERALRKFIVNKRPTHPIKPIKKQKSPDTVSKPKTYLTKLFNNNLGSKRKYRECQDAEPMVKCIDDFTRLKNSESFRRFARKTMGKNL